MRRLLTALKLSLFRFIADFFASRLLRRFADIASMHAPRPAYARAATRPQRVIDGEYRRLPDEPKHW